MLKNYLLSTYRSIKNRLFFSLINIFGFSLGIAAFIIIIQFVRYQSNFDDFNSRSIYRIRYDFHVNGELAFKSAQTFPSMGRFAKAELPEVKKFCRILKLERLIKYNEMKVSEKRIYIADSTFFDMFNIPIIAGNKLDFNNKNGIFFSESTAKKYFGNKDPLGQIILFDKGTPLILSGVFKDFPSNSHMKCDILVPYSTFSTYDNEGKYVENNWYWNLVYTYLDIDEHASTKIVEQKLQDLAKKHRGNLSKPNSKDFFYLQSIQNIHLHSDLESELELNGNERSVYFLIFISILILIIAIFNYINLSTSKAIERAREIGIRKVVGANKRQLIFQFLFEAFIINVISMVIAYCIIFIVKPSVEFFTEINLVFNVFHDYKLSIYLILILIGCTIGCGLYPAFILSSFDPENVLKGKYNPNYKGVNLRKILLVFQFSISIGLSIITYFLYYQHKFMLNKDLGFKSDNVLCIREPIWNTIDSTFNREYSLLAQRIKELHFVKNISYSCAVPSQDYDFKMIGFSFNNTSKATEKRPYNIILFDYDFVDVYQMKLLGGRNFSRDFPTDKEGVLINEVALYELGFKSQEEAIGKEINFEAPDQSYSFNKKILGVLQNYNQRTLTKNVEPYVFFLLSSGAQYYSLKLNTKSYLEAIDEIKVVWKSVFPEKSFDYFFVDDLIDKMYKDEKNYTIMFFLFSVLAIVISFLGLLALTAFSILQKRKEIAIRKMLGASLWSIFNILSKENLKLAIIANIITWPIVYYILDQWLGNYAYRVNINIGVFLLIGLSSVLLLMGAISYFVYFAAKADPVETLKDE